MRNISIIVQIALISSVGCSNWSNHESESSSNRIASLSPERDIKRAKFLRSDLSLSQDAYSELFSGLREGPFPLEPDGFSGAERLTKREFDRFKGIQVEAPITAELYQKLVQLENYFRINNRNKKFSDNYINEDILILGNSDITLALQYVFYELHSLKRANRYDGINLHSTEIPKPDLIGRNNLINDLRILSKKYGYTLTGYFWSGEINEFKGEAHSDYRTSALEFYLARE